MINLKKIEEIFKKASIDKYEVTDKVSDDLDSLISQLFSVNQYIWSLEDIVRIKELGFEKIAQTKSNIDVQNQLRNNIVRKMDAKIEIELDNSDLNDINKFYSESPAMIIDRLSIMFIRRLEIRKILDILPEGEIKDDYLSKEKLVNGQIERLGGFLDIFFSRIKSREGYFKIMEPIKIYNDERVKQYIKSLSNK